MKEAAKKNEFLNSVLEFFDRAAALTEHPSDLLLQIKSCNSIHRFQSPFRTSRGYEVLEARRAEHSHHKTPTEGGIRYSVVAHKEEVVTLENATGRPLDHGKRSR